MSKGMLLNQHVAFTWQAMPPLCSFLRFLQSCCYVLHHIVVCVFNFCFDMFLDLKTTDNIGRDVFLLVVRWGPIEVQASLINHSLWVYVPAIPVGSRDPTRRGVGRIIRWRPTTGWTQIGRRGRWVYWVGLLRPCHCPFGFLHVKDVPHPVWWHGWILMSGGPRNLQNP